MVSEAPATAVGSMAYPWDMGLACCPSQFTVGGIGRTGTRFDHDHHYGAWCPSCRRATFVSVVPLAVPDRGGPCIELTMPWATGRGRYSGTRVLGTSYCLSRPAPASIPAATQMESSVTR